MSKSKDARIAELEVNLAQAEANAAAYGKYIIELEARIAEIEKIIMDGTDVVAQDALYPELPEETIYSF